MASARSESEPALLNQSELSWRRVLARVKLKPQSLSVR